MRYFIAVAEEGSVSRASMRLAIAQPPLSQQILRFERSLGFALFQRTAKGVSLTPAGRSLLVNARRIVAEADAAVREATDVHLGVAGRLVVAFMSTAVHSILPPLLAAYRASRPNVAIEVREMTIGEQFDALVKGVSTPASCAHRWTIPGSRCSLSFVKDFWLLFRLGTHLPRVML